MKTRIIIADDHTIIREGLKALLEANGMDVIGIARNGREAIALSVGQMPDIVMMDISMPDLNGVDATAAIMKKVPGIKIIALSMHSHKDIIDNMFAAGACGYILKADAFGEICDAIHVVKNGRFYLTPSISRTFLNGDQNTFDSWEKTSRRHLISTKERQVLQLVAEGEKNRIIAEKLEISHKTVETHRRNIMKKLRIFSIAGLTKFAIKEGISPLE